MDELIRITQHLKVSSGEAMTVTRQPGKGRIFVDNVHVDFLEEGPLIILPLERWQRTLAKAVVNSAIAEAEEEQAVRRTRQVRRQIQRDLRN